MNRLRRSCLPLLVALGLTASVPVASAAAPPPPGAKKKSDKKKGAPPPPGAKEGDGDKGDAAGAEAASKSKVPAAGEASGAQDKAENEDYANEKYDVAAATFHGIATGKSGGDAGRAQFWLGKSLYKLGFYAAALAAFDEIVQAGSAHPYHQPTLPWLASLSRVLPEGAGVLEKIGTYKPADLENEAFDEVRDELYYLLGRFNYRKGDLGQAIALLSQVPDASDFFIPAQFFLGVSEMREMRAPEAVEGFRNVLRRNIQARDEAEARGEKRKKKLSERARKKLGISLAELEFREQNERYEETAAIALGYIYYQLGRYDTAITYFDRVPPASPYWLDAVFASAWSEFMLVQVEPDHANRHYQRALGYVHTINAPFFYDYLYPESLLLKAVTYYFNCRYGPAKGAIDEFNTRYLQTRKDLQGVLDAAPEDYGLYELTVQIRNEKAKLDPFVQQVARKSIQDKTLDKHYQYVERLEYEAELLSKQTNGFKNGDVGAYVDEQLELVTSVAKETTGGLARQRLAKAIEQIGKLRTDAIKVQYEIINKLKALGDESLGELQKPFVDSEHEIYNYNGEYWQDELGYYNYKVTNVCPE
ncbi:MAG: tetratricopeptide repeat protein [Myxococcales bacterium FL481]|nr:MAG: tetratricopeptide repeat protein [Myxococcales bacterium FL481]